LLIFFFTSYYSEKKLLRDDLKNDFNLFSTNSRLSCGDERKNLLWKLRKFSNEFADFSSGKSSHDIFSHTMWKFMHSIFLINSNIMKLLYTFLSLRSVNFFFTLCIPFSVSFWIERPSIHPQPIHAYQHFY